MLADQRRNQLLELIRNNGFATLPDLAMSLAVSESTIRRDLNSLERDGTAKRTHGGVVYTGTSPHVPHFERIQSKNWQNKKQIARAAAQLVEEGDTILLDGGTTTYQLAQRLVGRSIQVITNSIPVANLFSQNDQAELVFLGGCVQTRNGVTLGPHAIQMLKDLSCHRAFLSAAGINESGLFNSSLLLVETERAMMKSADQVVVVADATKFGRKGLSHLCELSDVNVMIVDDAISSTWQTTIRKSGVELTVAESNSITESTSK